MSTGHGIGVPPP